jgi:hypothetical protein
MVFSATFNNISAISCRSVLLADETGVPRKSWNNLTIAIEIFTGKKQSLFRNLINIVTIATEIIIVKKLTSHHCACAIHCISNSK